MRNINSEDRAALRRELCHQYHGLCFYCTRYVGMRGTIDHYLPQASGGTNARENLRWACTDCNYAKADMLPEEWLPVAEQRRAAFVRSQSSKRQRKIELLQLIAQRQRSLTR